MSQLLYFSYGIRKSGSTLAYELCRGLLESAGHDQKKLDLECFSNSKVNFLTHKQTEEFDEALADKILSKVDDGKYLVIKTHGPPSPYIIDQIEKGIFKAQANFRDPRDIVLSLYDASLKARKRGRGAFHNIDSVQAAITNIKEQMDIYKSWRSLNGVYSSNYEEVAFDSEKFLLQVAGQLGLQINKDIGLNSIIDSVKKDSFTQFNKGVPNRYQNEFSIKQALYLTHFFREELLEYHSEYLNKLDRTLLAEADSENDKTNLKKLFKKQNEAYQIISKPGKKNKPGNKVITEKTFVVLGCPRGGTSLLAGSLVRAGVYMGDYKTSQYEDPKFKIRPKNRDLALDKLSPIISKRNANYKFWGWKVPNNIYYIDQIRHLLINPVYLFIYRNPEAIARSSAKHDGKDWETHAERLLKVAHNHTEKVRHFQSKVGDKAHVFQLEEIHKNPEAFIKKLMDIVEPLNASQKNIEDFVNPKGGYV